MKLKNFLAMAAVLVSLFMFSAFAGDVGADRDTAAVNAESVDRTDQTTVLLPAVADRDIAGICEVHEAWVKERKGMTVLNARSEPIKAVRELEGFSEVEIKPKATTAFLAAPGAIGFNGLGGNHYARADV